MSGNLFFRCWSKVQWERKRNGVASKESIALKNPCNRSYCLIWALLSIVSNGRTDYEECQRD